MLKFIFLVVFIFFVGSLEIAWAFRTLLLGFLGLWFFVYRYRSILDICLVSRIYLTDSLSMSLISLTCWVGALILLRRQEILISNKKPQIFLILVLSIIFLLCLIFLSYNFFLFYVGFEAVLIPTFILIIGWGRQPERLNASFYFFIYTILRSLPLLGFFFYQYFKRGREFINFYRFFIYGVGSLWNGKGFLFLLIAFLVKLPLYGVHLWLPKAHVEAPVGGSIFLASILLKLGVYGLLRFLEYNIWYIFWIKTFLISLALVGACVISIFCFIQFDIKSLVAFTSVSHIAFVLCGILRSRIRGWRGSFLLSIAHGLASSGFFAIVTFIYDFSSRRRILFNKGLLLRFPMLGFFFFSFCILNIGAPPTLNLLREIILYIRIVSYRIRFLVLFFY
jgi:NADH-ubiquinone oxidoreductase chain 4